MAEDGSTDAELSETLPCRHCEESVSIDVDRCPHCSGWLLRSRSRLTFVMITGALITPVTLWLASLVLALWPPETVLWSVGFGVMFGLALIGPILIFLGGRGFARRRKVLDNAA